MFLLGQIRPTTTKELHHDWNHRLCWRSPRPGIRQRERETVQDESNSGPARNGWWNRPTACDLCPRPRWQHHRRRDQYLRWRQDRRSFPGFHRQTEWRSRLQWVARQRARLRQEIRWCPAHVYGLGNLPEIRHRQLRAHRLDSDGTLRGCPRRYQGQGRRQLGQRWFHVGHQGWFCHRLSCHRSRDGRNHVRTGFRLVVFERRQPFHVNSR